MPAWLLAIYILWAAWGASWIAAALWADRTVARPPLASELRYRLFTAAGFVALLGNFYARTHDGRVHSLLGPIAEPLWHDPAPIGWMLAALLALAIGFAWWARLHLGRLWSASLTRKAEHRVIDTGPYARVRHPIYTALLAGAIVTAAAKASPLAILGAALMIVGYRMKARQEEAFLRAELGPEAYDAYAARVPMLVPRF